MIVPLDFKKTPEIYFPLVPKEFHKVLKGGLLDYYTADHKPFGYGEIENGVARGILIASQAHNQIYIHYLYSPEPAKLIGQVKGKNLQLFYREENPYIKEIETACKELGWVGPHLHSAKYLIDIQKLHPAWLDREYTYARGYRSFRWVDLPTNERQRLEKEAAGGLIPHAYSPFDWVEPLEPLNSLGLSFEGRTVGWMVNHRVDPDIIRYTSFYTYYDYRNNGEIIKLLAESLKLQQGTEIPWVQFDLFVSGVHLGWKEFVRKRLRPYSIVSNKYTFYKS